MYFVYLPNMKTFLHYGKCGLSAQRFNNTLLSVAVVMYLIGLVVVSIDTPLFIR